MRTFFIGTAVVALVFALPVAAYESYFEHQVRPTTMIGTVQGSVLGEATSPLEDDYGTGTTVSEGIYCPELTRTMQRGARDVSTGGQVTELQLFLADYFGLNEEDLVTGFFGRLTQSYVIKFQQEKGLPARGIVGSLTRAAIAEACGSVQPASEVACSLTTDKGTYVYGEMITVSWASKGAIYGEWVKDASGKDNFYLGGDKLGTSGSLSFSANVLGNPFLTMRVHAANDKTADCKVTIPVSQTPVSPSVATTTALIVSTDVSSPAYWMVAAGTADATVGAYKFVAVNESITLRSVGVKLTSGVSGDVNKVSLYDGTTKVGEGYFIGSGTQAVITLTQPVVVPQNGAKVLTVKADIANIGTAQAVTVSGHLLQIDFYKGLGAGNTTGTQVYTTNTTNVAGVRIMKAIPVVALETLSQSGVEDGRLMRFKVAGHGGPINLGKMMFRIAATNVSVSNVQLYAYSDSNFSQPMSGVEADGRIPTTASSPAYLAFPATPVQIPANQSRFFELRASVSGVSNGSSVTTTILSDSAYIPMQSGIVLREKDTNFVWSPNTTTTAQFNTNDWTGGYGVAGLPASGLSFTRTGGTGTTAAGIKVTAPNGGERWEIGKLNTITWTPYGYNPDVNPSGQVTAELMKKTTSCPTNAKCEEYYSVGKILDTGKASIHTYFNINSYDTWPEPGEYKVRVTNNTTGASDMSDASFTLLPRAVDVKVNGSDGTVSVTDNQAVTVTWKATNPAFVSCNLEGVRKTPGTGVPTVITGLPLSGSATYYVWAPVPGGFSTVSMNCSDSNSSVTGYDYVGVLALSAPTTETPFVRIVQPNGGEQVQLGQQTIITFKARGVRSYSVAVYKNDQWLQWIAKDVTVANPAIEDEFGYPWTPSVTEFGTNLGSIYKIYVTGLKSDGSGYADDKSDSPFGFAGATPAPVIKSFTVTPSYITSRRGSAYLAWTTTNASRCVLQYDASEVSVNPNGSMQLFPTQTTTYKLWCANDPGTGKDGPATSATVTVYVEIPVIDRLNYVEP